MNEFADEADRRLSELSEDVARKLSRRQVLRKGVKGAVAAVAVLAFGGTAGVRDAVASSLVSCGCSYPGVRPLQLSRQDLPVGRRLPVRVLRLQEDDLPEHRVHLQHGELDRRRLPVRHLRVRLLPLLRLPLHELLQAVWLSQPVPLLRLL